MLRRLTIIVMVIAFSEMSWRSIAAESQPIDPVLLKRFEARTFQDKSGAVLKYRLFKPPAYSTNGTNYPLVLFLHGAAGLGDDNKNQFNGGNEVPPLALSEDDVQARFPCFVLAPQCPRGESWSGLGKEAAPMIRLTFGAIDALKQEFPLDPARFYLVGISMGGNGAWDVAVRFPDKFAALVPICGAGDTDTAKKLIKLPIWCFHGANDPLISVGYARRMIAALRKAGGHPRYTEYPGVGHDSYRNAFREPELLPWLFGQKR
jgi:predicted peptidase